MLHVVSYCNLSLVWGRERRQVQMLIKTLSLWVSAPLSSFTLAGQHGQTILHKYQSMQNFVQILWHSKMWLNLAPKYKGRHNSALIYISHYARSDHTWWWSHMIRSNISEPEWSLHILPKYVNSNIAGSGGQTHKDWSQFCAAVGCRWVGGKTTCLKVLRHSTVYCVICSKITLYQVYRVMI